MTQRHIFTTGRFNFQSQSILSPAFEPFSRPRVHEHQWAPPPTQVAAPPRCDDGGELILYYYYGTCFRLGKTPLEEGDACWYPIDLAHSPLAPGGGDHGLSEGG
jgi:hypothetical protein